MQRKRSAEELLFTRVWWSKADIRTVFGCSQNVANELWKRAREKDDIQPQFVIEPTKAKAETVCKVYGTSLKNEQNKVKRRAALGS